MPGRLKVKIVSGRDLPVMDRATELTDAFVEVRFANYAVSKTDVFRKSLSPQWNSEWFLFEVEDEELQDEPLQIRVLDYDTYSAHDAIGKVYIDLNPLLNKDEGPNIISGWFPIYDTMHGIRGEINILVKVDLFTDFNKFRQSSCGVQFFNTMGVPQGYKVQAIYGFVEELVVNDDPEYQWIDRIRTPRASNEARQRLFSKLAGELQRKIGLKVLEMGGNAVQGYLQCFDLEGESGIVVRGIGTATFVNKITILSSPSGISPLRDRHGSSLFVFPSQHSLHSGSRGSMNSSGGSPSPHNFQQYVSNVAQRRSFYANILHTAPVVAIPTQGYDSGCHSFSQAVNSQVSPKDSQTVGTFHFPFQNQNSSKLSSPVADDVITAPQMTAVSPTIAAIAITSAPVPGTVTAKSQPVPQTSMDSPLTGQHSHSGSPAPVTLTTSVSAPTQTTTVVASSSETQTTASTSTAGSAGKWGISPSSNVPGIPVPRRSSDSDICTPPRAGSVGAGSSGSGSGGGGTKGPGAKTQLLHYTTDMLEYPFFTMHSFPHWFLVHIGGVVSARSVKLLDKIHNPEEPETRDAWWAEIRMEIRSHARAMGCHAVVGYSEQTTICGEVIVLSAYGTAAKINLRSDMLPDQSLTPRTMPSVGLTPAVPPQSTNDRQPPSSAEKEKEQESKEGHKKLYVDINLANQMTGLGIVEDSPSMNCNLCHTPYRVSSVPFPVNLTHCLICKKKKVPDVMFMTIDPPSDIPTYGRGCLIQARICRSKRDLKGEANAREISDNLPFVEYELHNQLMNKLKMKGMNSLFGLKVQVVVGETLLSALATATAVYLLPLPAPPIPQIIGQATNEEETNDLMSLQKRIEAIIQKNKDLYDIGSIPELPEQHSPHRRSLSDDSDGEESDVELSCGNKDAFVLKVDDARDETVSSMLHGSIIPKGFDVCNTEYMPGSMSITQNLQMFTQVWRGQFLPIGSTCSVQFSQLLEMLLRKLFFKLRKMKPCLVSHLRFHLELPDEENVQVSIMGMCVRLPVPIAASDKLIVDTGFNSNQTSTVEHVTHIDDMMFPMEDELAAALGHGTKSQKMDIKPAGHGYLQQNVPIRSAVELTPLSWIPGVRIEHYIGNYNFFFIRETTSLREIGGLSGFMQSFLNEVFTIVRAHVRSLNGDALVSYRMSHCILMDNPHKNQAQCLINVSGDAVRMLTDSDIQLSTSLAPIPESSHRRCENSFDTDYSPERTTVC